jgi:ABC-type antimicrobial peptide transport system permease subunit
VALGADRPKVVRLVLREGLTLALIGIVLGLAGAAGAAQLVRGMLYNVRAIDPIAFGTVPLVLIVVATMAVYFPARRAARIEPVRVLKVD